MAIAVQVFPNSYYDSVQLLFITSTIKKMAGVETALVAMGTPANKDVFADIGLATAAVAAASPNDLIIGIRSSDSQVCELAMAGAQSMLNTTDEAEQGNISFASLEAAVQSDARANLCIIAVPGPFARNEAVKALEAGLHLLIFSDNVPIEDELAIKQLAGEKGLLCMGPDCGVTNINGISFLVGSIVRQGPIGICAASGVGLQEVATLIHNQGSGVSQGIGTGGKDLKDKIGGLTMLAGFAALENDPATRVIVLISRHPGPVALQKVLDRVKTCVKPVVICFMGCSPAEIEPAGKDYAANLEDAARLALQYVGIGLTTADRASFSEIARLETAAMSSEQRYLRGLFCGGTFSEEALVTLTPLIGDIYSNAPLAEDLRLAQSTVSHNHSVVDYGDEEFTVGRPHPVIDTEPRGRGILREAADPEVAVLLIDFILGPAVNSDPAGSVINQIRQAKKIVQDRGGYLSIVASVCGTEEDPQKLSVQEALLREAGVIVCADNYQAAMLAGEIVKARK